ncbi:MAG: hypothetical protein DYH20_04200 [Gammaproteobacteria bacterium PRO9]|nr:hypothetical protein [Gammaproteobacteria bacterium PRO9]
MRLKLLTVVALLAALANVPAIAATPAPADVVVAFNKAITARHVDEALKLLAPGSVQYTLRSSHPDMGDAAAKLTGDLITHWRVVTSVVLPATAAYDRLATITETRVDGELATVWAMISSTTVERDGTKRQAKFSEVYLMVHTADGWQIGAMADNRMSSDVTPDTPKPKP